MATAADKPIIVDGTFFIRKGPRVNAHAQRAALTEGGDTWRVQSGLVSLPFAFWNDGIAAFNKILVSGVDEPTARQ